GKPALLHDFLFSVGSHSLKFQLVRKFQGRSHASSSMSTTVVFGLRIFAESIVSSRWTTTHVRSARRHAVVPAQSGAAT
ncbi:hypothetical protein, partial [Burkholderia pseudomallei]